MGPILRDARLADVDLLVDLMGEFYAESGYPLPRGGARGAFETLVSSPALGRAWLVEVDGVAAGYLALTLSFSMEYGGATAFIDDYYLRPAQRGRGVGRAALAEAIRRAGELGVRALHLEVGRDNDVARQLYRNAGFVDHDRLLLTLPFATPLHLEELPADTS
jgi:diamine N-acetyltransferase